MNGFLVDTNVVSEPRRPRPNRGAVRWLEQTDERQLHLSVVTIGELRSGIERVANRTTRMELERKLVALRATFGSRILAFDEPVAERWGRLMAALAAKGRRLQAIDALIAATALEHGLTVVTRDVRGFRDTGVPVLDPFD